ncbi:YfcC family protein [Pseudobacillus badius]|uniref:YfcC family protein n=1 Tax=Bacillus badius TaxID=1455 RepID=UPI0007B075B3|nr:YfcC family protein [Bacillus badius]KZN99162.1 C4-dicarboxylate ABC transporter permease [Bacillus badius]MED0667581.1 YfcC family protein [Bacillus badius]OCS84100.1 C4-dicarboxylate ABC transporter permease [Bacillus badius]OVE52606.1 C4-dicarboxylate ABC transporter permease [Bacillus badius]TDW04608.1 putative ion transporter superfamily protein YfcC [Bacillus badius]
MGETNKDGSRRRKWKLYVPHVYVILFSIIVISAIATYVIPAGQYEQTEDKNGRTIVIDGTYHHVEQSPASFLDVFQSIHQGMLNSASIIFYIFIVGGSFGILHASGAIPAAVGSISKAMKGREYLLIPLLMTFFALSGAMLGLAEETIPYITILVPLMVLIGYDSIVGAAIVLLGTSAGFTAAFMNPFTVGVAQGIAQIPIFSGLGFRIVLWVIFLSVSIWYVMRYANKVKKDPKQSVLYGSGIKEFDAPETVEELTTRHKLIFLVLLGTLAGLAVGVMKYGWYLTEISGLFLFMGILMGIIAKMKIDAIAEAFIEGCRVIVMGALVVGVANAILVILQDGKVMDTILYGFSSSIGELPSGLAAFGMYIVQCALNFIVPSGSGQAALTMPIMVPLSDLVGVTRQTAVLAFQFGDGISNIFTPTSGYFMAGLALARIPWSKWVKWIFPLIIIHYVLGAIFVTVAHMIGFS